MQNHSLTSLFRSCVVDQVNKDKQILFVEIYLHVAANERDATVPLRNKILNGKLGVFNVAKIFDVLEGMFFDFGFLDVDLISSLVNMIFFAV